MVELNHLPVGRGELLNALVQDSMNLAFVSDDILCSAEAATGCCGRARGYDFFVELGCWLLPPKTVDAEITSDAVNPGTEGAG
jgi:hypothetical protein